MPCALPAVPLFRAGRRGPLHLQVDQRVADGGDEDKIEDTRSRATRQKRKNEPRG
jgi:hypothetical protein